MSAATDRRLDSTPVVEPASHGPAGATGTPEDSAAHHAGRGDELAAGSSPTSPTAVAARAPALTADQAARIRLLTRSAVDAIHQANRNRAAARRVGRNSA